MCHGVRYGTVWVGTVYTAYAQVLHAQERINCMHKTLCARTYKLHAPDTVCKNVQIACTRVLHERARMRSRSAHTWLRVMTLTNATYTNAYIMCKTVYIACTRVFAYLGFGAHITYRQTPPCTMKKVYVAPVVAHTTSGEKTIFSLARCIRTFTLCTRTCVYCTHQRSVSLY